MLNISLQGKRVWITGGSRGIGQACALLFARAGANVGLTYVSQEAEAHKTVSQCEELGVRAFAMRCDVTKQKQCQETFEFFLDKMLSIDILVNNAGIIKDDLFISSEPTDWDHLFQTNVFGSLYCMQLVSKNMLLEGNGKIINITSAAGTKGGRGQVLYAATKGAIEAATRSLATELGRKGITVNSIAPGVIETDMSREIRSLAPHEILQRQVIKRFGTPGEIATWAVMLSSSYGDFVTGQTFHIDGGLKMV